eukprot:COSAG02_NODE_300_length_25279_cov_159.676529_9_plen_51_part_00
MTCMALACGEVWKAQRPNVSTTVVTLSASRQWDAIPTAMSSNRSKVSMCD